ncbi:MAG: lanthionine synthetase C family protein [Simkaniaceae bacterium]|nr:lanthionine synthetase C family protein [Candidatus Sacchlamyda saccharinae]
MLALVEKVANKMQNPAEVKQACLKASAGMSLHRKVLWDDLSLSAGFPGLLLLFAQLEQLGLFEGVAHQYVLAIHQEIQGRTLNDLSLFGGVAGICFSLREASYEGTRYQAILRALDDVILRELDNVYLSPLRLHRNKQEPAPSFLHDLILGLPGIGRYLLEDLSLFGDLVEKSLICLINLCRPFVYKEKVVPGWILSAQDRLNTSSGTKPKENFNLGLAHGISGILAFFSIAWIKGVRVDGLQDMMLQIAEWIKKQKIASEGTIQWPACAAVEEDVICRPSRDAWCYGVPGIARTLFLCGKALENKALIQFSSRAFIQVFQRSREEWDLPGPTICHGIAGLLHITESMERSLGCKELLLPIEKLRKQLVDSYNPDALFGFRDLQLNEAGQLVEVDSATLLEGAAGILLVLLNRNSSWHLPFLVNT